MKIDEMKSHILTGISFMLPLVVGAGLAIAIGQILEKVGINKELCNNIIQIGVYGMGLMVPVFSAAIAYSIADKPGIAPGLVMGILANDIKTGFLGAIFFGFFVGVVVQFLKNYIKISKTFESLVPIMIIPLLSMVFCGLVGFYIIGVPLVALQENLINYLKTMDQSHKIVAGAIMGGMAGFDFGGPVNKTLSLFADGLLIDKIYEPEAIKVIASMVPPMGVGMSVFFTRNKWNIQEIEETKVAFPMGLCMITEGVIPIAARDPLRVIFSTTIGCMVAGALSLYWGVGSSIPSGGIFIIPFVYKPLHFILALGIGSTVTAILLSLLKKNSREQIVVQEDKLDLSAIKITKKTN
ncbi:MAG: PTS fructose transporter subunit IIC [Brevinema sp.]